MARRRAVQMKKPSNPYEVRKDGHSYLQLVGGPLDGGWFRFYYPMSDYYTSMGAIYKLQKLEQIDPKFPEDRQWSYALVGYMDGFAPEDLATERT